jgi:hypothetical protein
MNENVANMKSGVVSTVLWILSVLRCGVKHSLRLGQGILGRIILGEEDPAWILTLGRPGRSIRHLKHLGRLRRREGRIAWDLGSLARAVYRQGLPEEARRFGRAAFDHWRLARKAEKRIRRVAEDAPLRQAW